MIYVAYPPTLTRNFEGETDIVPSFFAELYIDEANESGKDILESIRDASFQVLQSHKYPSIVNFMVHQIGEDLANIHFQIPKYAIDMDRMKPDSRLISYYGIVRFFQSNETLSDIQN